MSVRNGYRTARSVLSIAALNTTTSVDKAQNVVKPKVYAQSKAYRNANYGKHAAPKMLVQVSDNGHCASVDYQTYAIFYGTQGVYTYDVGKPRDVVKQQIEQRNNNYHAEKLDNTV